LLEGADVNAQGGEYGNSLPAASYRGHDQIVQRLLKAEADFNAQCVCHGSALQAASYSGSRRGPMSTPRVDTMAVRCRRLHVTATTRSFQWLLENGADVNA
jgi:hypothetical protein